MIYDDVPANVRRLGQGACYIYKQAIERGTAPMMAEMFACRKAPNSSTDTQVCRGDGMLLDQFDGDEPYVNAIVAEARKHGYNPSPNDSYDQHLAQFPGDPDAFIPHHDAKAHIKRVVEKQNRFCDGFVKNEVREEEPEDLPVIGQDIVARLCADEIQRDPKIALSSKKEITEEMIRRHGPSDEDDGTYVGLDAMERLGDTNNH